MLDLNLIGDYWGWYGSRFYHHTGLVSLWCAAPLWPQTPCIFLLIYCTLQKLVPYRWYCRQDRHWYAAQLCHLPAGTWCITAEPHR
jgi:hypothetical protein